MLKSLVKLIMIVSLAFSASGCALLGTALSAGIAYGIYQATHD